MGAKPSKLHNLRDLPALPEDLCRFFGPPSLVLDNKVRRLAFYNSLSSMPDLDSP
jgi:hypothetical protein